LLVAAVCQAAPQWTTALPLRYAGLEPVVSDVQSHLPEGNVYWDADRVTCVHESTHGVNSLLRNRYGRPAFYVLNNKAILLNEVRTTISEIARDVPVSLRGDVYQLYLIQSQRDWNNYPSYILDEWVAYTNGGEARQTLNIIDRAETTRYALEFCVYSTYVVARGDAQMREFYKWQVERVIRLHRQAGLNGDYLNRLRLSPDAVQLRIWLRETYGQKWTKSFLGF
jgi:hypothetical protein